MTRIIAIWTLFHQFLIGQFPFPRIRNEDLHILFEIFRNESHKLEENKPKNFFGLGGLVTQRKKGAFWEHFLGHPPPPSSFSSCEICENYFYKGKKNLQEAGLKIISKFS